MKKEMNPGFLITNKDVLARICGGNGCTCFCREIIVNTYGEGACSESFYSRVSFRKSGYKVGALAVKFMDNTNEAECENICARSGLAMGYCSSDQF